MELVTRSPAAYGDISNASGGEWHHFLTQSLECLVDQQTTSLVGSKLLVGCVCPLLVDLLHFRIKIDYI